MQNPTSGNAPGMPSALQIESACEDIQQSASLARLLSIASTVQGLEMNKKDVEAVADIILGNLLIALDRLSEKSL